MAAEAEFHRPVVLAAGEVACRRRAAVVASRRPQVVAGVAAAEEVAGRSL